MNTPMVKLSRLIKEFSLENCIIKTILMIYSSPQLTLTDRGFSLQVFEYFGTDRVQIIGKVEMTYLSELESNQRYERLRALFQQVYHVWYWQEG